MRKVKKKMKKEIMMACTTFSSQEKAQECCRKLIKKNLIACAQVIGPITSSYFWEDQCCEETEWKIEIKTSVDKVKEVENAVLLLHEYDLPQWITWKASASTAYGKWVESGN